MLVSKEWLLLLAIGFCFVAIGSIADFLIKKKEVSYLHAVFQKWSIDIEKIPLLLWQINIASFSIKLISRASIISEHGVFSNANNHTSNVEDDTFGDEEGESLNWCDLKLMLAKNVSSLPVEGKNNMIIAKIGNRFHVRIFDSDGKIVIDKGKNQFFPGYTLYHELEYALKSQLVDQLSDQYVHKIINAVTSSLSRTKYFFSSLLFIILTPWVFIYAIWLYEWLFNMLMFPFVMFFIFGSVLIFHEVKYEFNQTSQLIAKYWLLLISGSLLSVMFTAIATFIAVTFIPSNILTTSWFVFEEQSLIPSRPFVLALINYPFDMMTIAVTLYLLKLVINRGRYIFTVAVLDVFVSFILTVLLHSLIKYISGETEASFFSLIYESWFWTSSILNDLAFMALSQENWSMISRVEDAHLIPIVLSTFIPVCMYVTMFLFISVLKPFVWISARLFSVIAERKESVFRQLGMVLTFILTAVKSVMDYIDVG